MAHSRPARRAGSPRSATPTRRAAARGRDCGLGRGTATSTSSATLAEVFAAAGVEHTARCSRRSTRGGSRTPISDPDAADLFAACASAGCKIGVLSNTIWPRAEHERIFERDGSSTLIDGAVYTSEITWTKPHPEAFRAALDAVGVADPARAVFVGDRPFDDIHGAAAVGMRTILDPAQRHPAPSSIGHTEGEPDAVVAAPRRRAARRRRLAADSQDVRGLPGLRSMLDRMLVRVLRNLPRAVPPLAGRRRRPATDQHARRAVPAEPERRHHRQRRRARRHRLHRAGRRLDAAVSLVQIVASIAAVFFGARTAMSFGRDLRARLFGKVGTFSAREVAHFGAPSLITRNTNDVQQVQMLVVMACTLMIGAPIMCVGGIVMALREDVGMSLAARRERSGARRRHRHDRPRMVPQFRTMQARIDTVNRVLREQIGGIRVVRAFVREPAGDGRFGRRERRTHRHRHPRRPADGADVPDRDARAQPVQRRGALVRRRTHRRRADADRFADRVPHLPRADPDVGDDGDLHADDGAARGRVRRPRAGGARHRLVRGRRRTIPSRTSHPAHAQVEFRDVDVPLPGRGRAGADRSDAARARRARRRRSSAARARASRRCSRSIPRLFDATAGAVLVDGVDVRDLDPEVLWRRIGLVPQKAYLFTGTVASNLRYGNAGRDRRRAVGRAAHRAGARLRRRRCPAGSRRRSRRAARTCPAASGSGSRSRERSSGVPEIYLFDESFSALDLGTDARLRAALRPVTRDAAVLVVASRISTIIDADQIVVLDGGRRRRPRHATTSCSRPARPTPRSSSRSSRRRMPHERRQPSKDKARSLPQRLPAAGGEARRGGGPPWMGAAMPAEKAMTFGPSARRLLRRLRPERARIAARARARRRQRHAHRSSGRSCSATRPT